jgi:hypothetical protein
MTPNRKRKAGMVLAGSMFIAAGLIFMLAGNTAIGIAEVALGVVFLALGVKAARAAEDSEPRPPAG